MSIEQIKEETDDEVKKEISEIVSTEEVKIRTEIENIPLEVCKTVKEGVETVKEDVDTVKEVIKDTKENVSFFASLCSRFCIDSENENEKEDKL